MFRASDEQVEKVKEWQEKYSEMDKWYKTMTPKVEGNFNMGKTLPIVQKQITELQVKYTAILCHNPKACNNRYRLSRRKNSLGLGQNYIRAPMTSLFSNNKKTKNR